MDAEQKRKELLYEAGLTAGDKLIRVFKTVLQKRVTQDQLVIQKQESDQEA